MKLPLRIKETLYHDSETGKPVGTEYWVFDDAADELFVINDDEDAARRICAAVNACEGIETKRLESGKLIFELRERSKLFEEVFQRNAEIEHLRQQNAELGEALKIVMPYMEDLESENFEDESVGIRQDRQQTEAIIIARAALSKYEPADQSA